MIPEALCTLFGKIILAAGLGGGFKGTGFRQGGHENYMANIQTHGSEGMTFKDVDCAECGV